MRELLERNVLAPADIVSCIFTMTDDLNAEFPAVAARHMGFEPRAAAVRARDRRARARCRASSACSSTTTPPTTHEAAARLPAARRARCARTSHGAQ